METLGGKWGVAPIYLQQQPKEVTVTWIFWYTTSEPAPLQNIYSSGLKITMPVETQILCHIHKNSLFVFPTHTQVANAIVLAQFSRVLFLVRSAWAEKLLRLLTTAWRGILAGELMYGITAISSLNRTRLWLPFFLSILLFSQQVQTNFNSTK